VATTTMASRNLTLVIPSSLFLLPHHKRLFRFFLTVSDLEKSLTVAPRRPGVTGL